MYSFCTRLNGVGCTRLDGVRKSGRQKDTSCVKVVCQMGFDKKGMLGGILRLYGVRINL